MAEPPATPGLLLASSYPPQVQCAALINPPLSTANMSPEITKSPTVLIVLDGWGYREDPRDNAIANADTPVWDRLWSQAPHTLVSGSGEDVGLPAGQMGNSEVGHMSLGSGRVVYQSISRIDQAIKDGGFYDNKAYGDAIDAVVASGKQLHLIGLLSDGGVHSHERHFHALLDMAQRRGCRNICVHAILDGRDTPPRSALRSIEALENKLAALHCGRIVSVVGRFYAMDRDQRWDRVESAWQLFTHHKAGHHAATAAEALAAAYARDENDEFVAATLIGDSRGIVDGDAVIFMNFRADRAREICQCFLDAEFSGFDRKGVPALAAFVTTTEYSEDLIAPCAFPPSELNDSLGEVMEQLGKTQLRLAETEKYAHVTFFFSGGREQKYQGETRCLIPSPKVATYDLKPEMSAPEVTDALVDAITGGEYDLIVCNYANGDMVGHTGNYQAAIQAVEALDGCLGRVVAAISESGGQALITADHGNCEQMVNYEAKQAHTQHTTEHVPLVYVGPRALQLDPSGGILADVAPTLLALMDLPQPAAMTGRSLIA